MGLGKITRLRRIFGHPSGRLFSVAVDHFINHGDALPPGLRRIKGTLAAIVAGRPDALTMHKGVAESLWGPYAGHVPLILQTIIARPDDSAWERVTAVDEAVRLGADAVAAAAFIRGSSEGAHLRAVANVVREARLFDLPVVCHIYPRVIGQDGAVTASVSLAPEDIAWAVRCALELGADVIKTPYCGEVAAFQDIVSECPRPIVIAGGPQTPTLLHALAMTRDAARAGAKGATVGRNVWGSPHVTGAVRAFRAVVHQGCDPERALEAAGLAVGPRPLQDTAATT